LGVKEKVRGPGTSPRTEPAPRAEGPQEDTSTSTKEPSTELGATGREEGGMMDARVQDGKKSVLAHCQSSKEMRIIKEGDAENIYRQSLGVNNHGVVARGEEKMGIK